MTPELQAEGAGETVGEAKWQALRELERLHPGLDKALVRFEVLEEGQRGLLGVGYSPARVLASVPDEAVEVSDNGAEESGLAADVRGLLEQITRAMALPCRIALVEEEEALLATCSGPDLGLLIGKHGQTIDAVQYLVNAIVHRSHGAAAKHVTVDAAGYRDRRRVTLESIAARAAERARDGQRVELEPMSAAERKVVHLALQDDPAVATESEGAEPHRYVVVLPASG